MSAISVQPLTTVEEFREALALQQAIWGFSDAELLPARMFVVASKIGGQVLGAFDGARMIGFCVAMPGLKPGGGGFLHSHMLGVLPSATSVMAGSTLRMASPNRLCLYTYWLRTMWPNWKSPHISLPMPHHLTL